MDKHRAFPNQWQRNRLIERPAEPRAIYVLPGLAWGAAWPHLDSWFQPEAFFIPNTLSRLPGPIV